MSSEAIQNTVIIIGGLLMASISIGAIALVIWSWYRKRMARRHAAHHTTGVNPPPVVPTSPAPTPTPAPTTTPVVPVAPTVAPTLVTPQQPTSNTNQTPLGKMATIFNWLKDAMTKFGKILITIGIYILVFWGFKLGYSLIPSDMEIIYKIVLVAIMLVVAVKIVVKATEKIDWVPTISPIVLSLIWAGILLLIERYLVEYIVLQSIKLELETLADLIPTKIVIEVLIGALFLFAWLKMWRTNPVSADKKDDKDKGSTKKILLTEIPDGHKAIFQFLGIPFKFFVIGEGKLCLPPFCEATPVDMRKRTFQIPAIKEELGIIVTTSDKQQVHVRISFTVKIKSVFTALFVVGPGAADDGMRNTSIQAARRGAAKCTMDQILDANSDERVNMEDSLRESVKLGAYDMGLEADPKSLTVSKAVPVNSKVTEALEALVVQENENKAKKARSDAIQRMTEEIYTSRFGGTPPAQHDPMVWAWAIEQANLRMGISTKQVIDTTAPVSLLMSQTPPPATSGPGKK